MTCKRKGMLILSLALLFSGCGGGGGGGDSSGTTVTPTPVQLETTFVDLSGPAVHPDGGTITVTVDDVAATVADGKWSYSLPLDSSIKAPIVKMYRDGELVLMRQLQITRTP